MDVVVNDLWREYLTSKITCDNEVPASTLSLYKHRGPVTDASVFRVPLDAANPYIQMKVSWRTENNELVDWYEKTIPIPPEEWNTYRQDFSEWPPGGSWVLYVLSYSVEVVRGP